MSKKKEIVLHFTNNISNEDQDLLNSFCSSAERLFQTKLIREPFPYSGHVNYNQESGLSFTTKLPPEEQLVELFVAYRFFYLAKERTHFLSVLKRLGRYARDDTSRQGLKQIKTRWNTALFSGALNLKIDGIEITAAYLFDQWFNAYYFHGDVEKRIKLEWLNTSVSEEFSKYMLLDAVIECGRIIELFYRGIKGAATE